MNQELIHIDDGNVSFQSKELTNLQESEWNQIRGKDISFIFQDPLSSLNPTMKVGKQITEVILQHGKKSKREAKGIAINLLTDLGIHEAEKRFEQYPHQLSGDEATYLFSNCVCLSSKACNCRRADNSVRCNDSETNYGAIKRKKRKTKYEYFINYT